MEVDREGRIDSSCPVPDAPKRSGCVFSVEIREGAPASKDGTGYRSFLNSLVSGRYLSSRCEV